VAASRGRESVTVITSDTELLRESIGYSSERQSASELARRMTTREEPALERPGLQHGIYRGLEAARELALYGAQHEPGARRTPTVEQALEYQGPQRQQPRQTPEKKKEIERGYDYGIGI